MNDFGSLTEWSGWDGQDGQDGQDGMDSATHHPLQERLAHHLGFASAAPCRHDLVGKSLQMRSDSSDLSIIEFATCLPDHLDEMSAFPFGDGTTDVPLRSISRDQFFS